MERWAANTLRTIGIILSSGFTLIVSLLLALLSFCAAAGGFSGYKNPDQALGYGMGAFFVLLAGIGFIVWLARGYQPEPLPGYIPAGAPATGSAESSLPLHLSPASRKAIDRLVLAMGAQIAVSALAWVINQLNFWTRPAALTSHNWILLLLAPFVLYHVPYAILIYALIKNPSRIVFTYAVAVPSVAILQALFSLTLVIYYFVHHPMGFLLLLVPWAIHIAVIVLAYEVIQQVGQHPSPGSIMVAAMVTFLFFTFIHALTPFLYRRMW